MDLEVCCQLIFLHPFSAEQAVQYDDSQAYDGRLHHKVLALGHQRVKVGCMWQLQEISGRRTWAFLPDFCGVCSSASLGGHSPA